MEFKNHVVQYPSRVKIIEEDQAFAFGKDELYVSMQRAEGQVYNQGTIINKSNLDQAVEEIVSALTQGKIPIVFKNSNNSHGGVTHNLVFATYGSDIVVNANKITVVGTTITATAADGYSFSSWSNLAGTVTSGRVITAIFA